MSYFDEPVRTNAIAAMRALCDFLEANPELDMPGSFSPPHYVHSPHDLYSQDGQALTQEWFIKQAAILGSEAVVSQDFRYFSASRDFGAGFNLLLIAPVIAMCKVSKTVEKVPTVAEIAHISYACPPEIAALGFIDPGEITEKDLQ